MAESELIVLCDQQGRPTGTAEKLATHTSKTPLHRAFSCYLFDDQGRLLITQRAAVKKVWPTVWTNSCCGHPAPDEADQTAIARRLQYELGMTSDEPVCLVDDYIYQTPQYRGIVEHEFCPIYAVRSSQQPAPNPDEVDAYRWVSWEEYQKLLQDDKSDVFSWWAKDQLKHILQSELLADFI